MIPPQDSRVQLSRYPALVRFCLCQLRARGRDLRFEGVVHSIKRSESFQIGRVPGVFSREEGGDLPLGRGAVGGEGLVVLAGGAEAGLGGGEV